MIRRVTNLFKHTDLNIAFGATNTLQQKLSKKQNNKNTSGIYKLKCNTCNKAYIGQSVRSIDIRHKEHIRYIRNNNPPMSCTSYKTDTNTGQKKTRCNY